MHPQLPTSRQSWAALYQPCSGHKLYNAMHCMHKDLNSPQG